MSDKAPPKVDAVYCGVDWISASLAREELDDQVWLSDCLDALSEVQAVGNVYKKRSMLGFDGWECGGCFVGSNDTRHYAQFAGKYAQEAYTAVDHPKAHISRIDLQVTVKYADERQKEGRYCYARAINYNKVLPTFRQRKIYLFAGNDGSDTIYIGAPSSETRGRIYNKDKQSGDNVYRNAWRWEVVYRNDHASSVFRQLLSRDTAVNDAIVSLVGGYMAERGITIRGVGSFTGSTLTMEKSTPSDVERKLKWIRHQVVPTIRKLAELGYAEELMNEIAEAIAAARNSQL